ncbi:hypothetical protein PR048_027693 [Dryococelus australis]|uniref:Uncharacterized protein n=1 Tax=Dryococelus australis TaxID=614101 RepID=A0ABQ9GH86_9NEOP|nr:hypothetical protein PR048_027693 [Dryococelus australis]
MFVFGLLDISSVNSFVICNAMFEPVGGLEFHSSVMQVRKLLLPQGKEALVKIIAHKGARIKDESKQTEEYTCQDSQRREASVKYAVSTKLNLDLVHGSPMLQ